MLVVCAYKSIFRIDVCLHVVRYGTRVDTVLFASGEAVIGGRMHVICLILMCFAHVAAVATALPRGGPHRREQDKHDDRRVFCPDVPGARRHTCTLPRLSVCGTGAESCALSGKHVCLHVCGDYASSVSYGVETQFESEYAAYHVCDTLDRVCRRKHH